MLDLVRTYWDVQKGLFDSDVKVYDSKVKAATGGNIDYIYGRLTTIRVARYGDIFTR